MAHSDVGALVVLAVLVSSLGACGRGTPPRSDQNPADSLATAQMAVKALQALPGHAGPYQVVSFRRDSAGVLVGLQRRGAVLRDGALVRVPRDGAPLVERVWP